MKGRVMLNSKMGPGELSDKISAEAKNVAAADPDFASIRRNIQELIPLAASSGAPRGQDVEEILMRSILLINADGTTEAANLLRLAALRIKDHSPRP